MRSMTGFGRGELKTDAVRIVVDVRTVNHKGLDVKVRLPREAAQHESAVTRAVQQALQRGRVDVHVEIELADAARSPLDAAALMALVAEVRRVAQELQVAPGLGEGDLLRVALQTRGVAPAATLDDPAPLLHAVGAALSALEAARTQEGTALRRLLGARLDAIAQLTAALRARSQGAPERAAERLRTRLGALLQDSAHNLDAARLAQEVALLADRLDVTEELERLTLHVELGRALLVAAEPAGRKLDFLCQELLREANTAGSKVQDAAATHLVVELKSEIERLREQAQNVE